MATHVWDDETEGGVWVVEPGLHTKDCESAYSSDSDATLSSMETIDSTEAAGAPNFNYRHWMYLTRFYADYFRVEYGRAFPMYEELPMALPADQAEIYRLKIQHLALKKLVGNALDAAIEAQLAPSSDGRQKCILDVRTQSGIW